MTPFQRALAGLAAASIALVALAGCATPNAPSNAKPTATASSSPDAPDAPDEGRRRAPDAVGAVVSVTVEAEAVEVVFSPDAGYEYFEGTTFEIPFDAAFAIDGEEMLELAELEAGDRLNVWTSACRESFPVQCDVEAVTAAS